MTPSATVWPSWTGGDPTITGAQTSGVASYDIRYRTSTLGAAFSAYLYPPAWTRTINHSVTVTPAATPGVQYCFSVLDRDHYDNLSPWSADHCTSVPLDDRALTTTASRGTGGVYYRGTYSSSAKAGTTFTRSGLTADRVGVVVTTRPSCGAIDITFAGKPLGRISLHSSTPQNQQTRWLPVFALWSGTLTVKNASNARVIVDGVITLR